MYVLGHTSLPIQKKLVVRVAGFEPAMPATALAPKASDLTWLAYTRIWPAFFRLTPAIKTLLNPTNYRTRRILAPEKSNLGFNIKLYFKRTINASVNFFTLPVVNVGLSTKVGAVFDFFEVDCINCLFFPVSARCTFGYSHELANKPARGLFIPFAITAITA